jgi:hypothetical protein
MKDIVRNAAEKEDIARAALDAAAQAKARAQAIITDAELYIKAKALKGTMPKKKKNESDDEEKDEQEEEKKSKKSATDKQEKRTIGNHRTPFLSILFLFEFQYACTKKKTNEY